MGKTILIAGLGLIGGSIAKGIKKQYPEDTIIAYNRSLAPLEFAEAHGIADIVSQDFQEVAVQADVIFLGFPVKRCLDFMQELVHLPLKDRVLVTDVGSTKREIVRFAERVFKDTSIHFVGGHPMAGSHKTGVVASEVDLFENAYYILSKTAVSTQEDVEQLKELLLGLQAKYIEIDAATHDAITCMTSHFPHILAAGLVQSATAFTEKFPLTKHLVAGGFRDMTRIAESSPEMWTDILLSNQENVLEQIDRFEALLAQVRAMVSSKDNEKIWQFFDMAREERSAMPIHKEGAMPAFHDLLLYVPDEIGSIHRVTGIMLEEKISIINIKIIETREETEGILQLSFRNEKDLEKARGVLQGIAGFRLFNC